MAKIFSANVYGADGPSPQRDIEETEDRPVVAARAVFNAVIRRIFLSCVAICFMNVVFMNVAFMNAVSMNAVFMKLCQGNAASNSLRDSPRQVIDTAVERCQLRVIALGKVDLKGIV